MKEGRFALLIWITCFFMLLGVLASILISQVLIYIWWLGAIIGILVITKESRILRKFQVSY